MNVFLTGGTGFIGTELTKNLLAQGWTVNVLARNPNSAPAQKLTAMGARCVRGDVTDRASVLAAMAGAEMVIHNAGYYAVGLDARGRQAMFDINVTGTDYVLGCAYELGIARVVYVSSTVAFGPSGKEVLDETHVRTTPYAYWYDETKTRAHDVAMGYRGKGLPLVTVCPSQVIGPNDHSPFGHFIRMYLNGVMTPFAWSPEIALTFVHVEDLCRGIVLAAQKGKIGELYILGSHIQDKRTYLNTWTARPGGMKVRFYIPRWLAKILFAPMPFFLRLAGLSGFISLEAVQADLDVRATSAKAQRELGWTFRSAEALWLDTLDAEIALLKKRQGQSLIERLKPME